MTFFTSFFDLIIPSKNEKTRNVFFIGKGGVGKTTCATVVAVTLAEHGYKTLLVSTDPAHSISWVLDQKITNKPTSIQGVKNLDAIQIDPQKIIEEQKRDIGDKIRRIVGETAMGIEDYIEAAAISPGMEESAAFDKFIEFLSMEYYDVIVFDTAPTGYTLRILSLSKIFKTWIERLIEVRKRAITLRRIVSRAPIEDVILTDLEIMRKRFEVADKILRDPKKTSFILVLEPEWTPILEAERATKLIENMGILVGGVIVNRVLQPEISSHNFYRERRKMQENYLEIIKKKFAGKIIVTLPLLERDIRGLDLIKRLSSYILR
jgi:arsenite-transporting ATPase